MKKLLIFSIAVLFISVSFGQIEESKVPMAVKQMMQARFTSAKDVKWSKADTIYSAEFMMDESKTVAEFDTVGKWINTQWEIPMEYTPAAIKKYLDSAYTGYKMMDLAIIDFAVDGKLYVTNIIKKKECLGVFFSLTGEFRKTGVCTNQTNCGKDMKCCSSKKKGKCCESKK